MSKNNKKAQFYIIPFIISFIFIIFIHSMNVSPRYVPLRSEKESAIFFDKSAESENYISVRASRTKTADVFAGRDTLPNFVNKPENHFIFDRLIKFAGKTIENSFFYSILERYKTRILLI